MRIMGLLGRVGNRISISKSSSVLALLVERHHGHPVCKKICSVNTKILLTRETLGGRPDQERNAYATRTPRERKPPPCQL